MNKEIKLSKWWRTPSAKAAFRRVAAAKRVKVKEMRARFAAARSKKTAPATRVASQGR